MFGDELDVDGIGTVLGVDQRLSLDRMLGTQVGSNSRRRGQHAVWLEISRSESRTHPLDPDDPAPVDPGVDLVGVPLDGGGVLALAFGERDQRGVEPFDRLVDVGAAEIAIAGGTCVRSEEPAHLADRRAACVEVRPEHCVDRFRVAGAHHIGVGRGRQRTVEDGVGIGVGRSTAEVGVGLAQVAGGDGEPSVRCLRPLGGHPQPFVRVGGPGHGGVDVPLQRRELRAEVGEAGALPVRLAAEHRLDPDVGVAQPFRQRGRLVLVRGEVVACCCQCVGGLACLPGDGVAFGLGGADGIDDRREHDAGVRALAGIEGVDGRRGRCGARRVGRGAGRGVRTPRRLRRCRGRRGVAAPPTARR